MVKKNYASIFMVGLTVFILNTSVFAQDRHIIGPVLSDNSVSETPSIVRKKNTGLIAANAQAASEAVESEEADFQEDDLDEELFEEFDDTAELQLIADPLYYFNYAMYSVNDFLYFAAIKPIATGYKFIIPTPVRKGVNNFFHNLLFPVRFINNLLQGEIKDAGTEFQVFLINSTFGVLGFNQVAQNDFDLQTNDEDLGLTFGSYSIGQGFYLVLPILGPSTLRDALGRVGDSFLTPVNYAEPWELLWGLRITDSVNATSLRLGDYEALKKAAMNPYTALRNAYIQYRKEKLKN